MAKPMYQMLREAADALEEQDRHNSVDTTPPPAVAPPSPNISSGPTAPDRHSRGTIAHAEVRAMFTPYASPARGLRRSSMIPPATVPKKVKKLTYTHIFFCLAGRKDCEVPTSRSVRQDLQNAGLGEKKITFPDKQCHSSEFSDTLQHNFPQLKECGGFVLLRSRGSTRSKALDLIPCPQEGYTPVYLCRQELGVGAAVLYIRPLQKDIDLESHPDQPMTQQGSGPFVECVYCAEIIEMSQMEDHVDICEKKSNFDAGEGTSSGTGPGTASTGPDQASTSGYLPIQPGTAEGSSSGTSEAEGSSAGTQRSAMSWEKQPSGYEEWKTEPNLFKAAYLFRRHLVHGAQRNRELVVRLDIRSSEEEREREILSFYKRPGIDWASPFALVMDGEAAFGDGLKKQFFQTVMEKVETGFELNLDNTGGTWLFNGAEDHKIPSTSRVLEEGDLFRVAGRIFGHSFLHGGPTFTGLSPVVLQIIQGDKDNFHALDLCDCPDTDVVEVVSLLESQRDLTPEEKSQVDSLGVAWYFPAVNNENRRWLAVNILQYAVIERRKTQVKQLRKGLKDTGVLEMVKERPALAEVLFPRAASKVIYPEMVLKRIIWPMTDSDDEDGNVEETCRVTGFLRTYIETGSSDDLRKLLEFWTAWTVLPQQGDYLYVEVDPKAELPKASTCSTTLRLPLNTCTYQEFTKNLMASVESTKFWFGMV